MSRDQKLKIKQYRNIQEDYERLYNERKLQHKECCKRLSDKYFLAPGTIQKILQKNLDEMEREIYDKRQQDLFDNS